MPLSRYELDSSEFTRMLKLSFRKNLYLHKPQPKLFNLATDLIPMRRTTEPEALLSLLGARIPRGLRRMPPGIGTLPNIGNFSTC